MSVSVLRPSGDFRTSYLTDKTIFPSRAGTIACVVGVLLLMLCPLFLQRYELSLMIYIGIYAVAALGLNILTGFCGQISLGHGAFFGLGAFGSTYLSNRYSIPVPLSIPLAGLIATAIGMFVGIPAARIKGLYLAIATLAAQYLLEDFFSRAEWFTGGAAGAFAKPYALFGYQLSGDRLYFYVVLAHLVILTLFAANFLRSRTGRAFVAIRDHYLSAEIMGIPLTRYKILAFGISTFYAGVAGGLMAHFTGFVSAESVNLLLSIQFFAMIIIGGLGSVMGTLMGAIFIVLLPEVLEFIVSALKGTGLPFISHASNSLDFAKEASIGLVIILFLIFEPKGLIHRWHLIKAYWKLFPFAH
ncbi:MULTISPECIES: branched-chain amino acid ABC transporter permease [unclassified Afipia]|uniref:branched-chain amino acid ABC transporter permease n=1 Tax=unclassified Afipia TaxID=2642050 RepID=UPI000406697F|nr:MULTISPECIES: branched-chain amino acid ABC transporter permease [unclassified Afipia]